MSATRAEREAAGRRAETLASVWLQLKGYRILARRYQGPGGEVDLVVAWPLIGRIRTIAFVEVKQRSDTSQFADAISPAQRRRIEAGASSFVGANASIAQAAMRFDGVFVAPGRLPRHVPSLWRAGE